MQIIRSSEIPSLIASGLVVSGESYIVSDWPGCALVGSSSGHLSGCIGTFGSLHSLPDHNWFHPGSRARIRTGGEAVAHSSGWIPAMVGEDPVIAGVRLALPTSTSTPTSVFDAEAAQDAAAAALEAGQHDGASVDYDDPGNRISITTGTRSFGGATYDAQGRVTAFTSNGVAFTVAYPSALQIVVSGGGSVRTIVLDTSGRLVSVTTS